MMQNKLLTILLLISIYFTTIVYSAFDTRLQIEGDAVVRTDQSIRITNLELTNTVNDAYEEYNSKYGKDTTSMYLILPASSSITYTVEITNKVSDSYLIDSIEEISNTNNNIDIDLSLNINDIVNGNSTKTFSIIITNDTDSEQYETLVIQYGFKLNSFTVTFDANGGSVDTSSKTVSYGSNYGTLPTPTRPGYKFLGWNGKNMFNEEEILMEIVGATYDNEYYNFDVGNAHAKYYNGISQLKSFKENTQYTLSFIANTTFAIQGQWTNYRIGFKTNISQNMLFIDHALTESIEPRYYYVTTPINSTVEYIYNTFGYGGTVHMKNVQLEEASYATEYEPYYITSSTKVVQPNNHTLKAIWETEMENNVVEYSTPNSYEFIAPKSGTYKVELWGASGGSPTSINHGGLGASTSGKIVLRKSEKMFVYVGETGSETFSKLDNTYNGGGKGNGSNTSNGSYHAASGGGATDIRLTSGNWNSFDSLKTRIMIAGGGGGGFSFQNDLSWGGIGGSGGGLYGYDGTSTREGDAAGIGGTQTSGGTYDGKFGRGGNSAESGSHIFSSGGGSGYYGGGAGWHVVGAAGGSSFISGHSGCDAIDKNSTSDNIIHTNQPNHYSGKVFTDTLMIDGAGCKWTNELTTDCSGQIQPDGTYATGHTGNGYARITFIG